MRSKKADGESRQRVQREPPKHGVVFTQWPLSDLSGTNLNEGPSKRLSGFSIARAHWRKGFASEVVSAVVDAAFRNIAPLARVRAMADARNAASMRVMEKVGMTRERVLGANRVVRGECIDEVWFELTRDTWADVDR